MMSNHIVNHITSINSNEIKKIQKIYAYSDKCLECIILQKPIEPFENFNPRNRKSVIMYDGKNNFKR